MKSQIQRQAWINYPLWKYYRNGNSRVKNILTSYISRLCRRSQMKDLRSSKLRRSQLKITKVRILMKVWAKRIKERPWKNPKLTKMKVLKIWMMSQLINQRWVNSTIREITLRLCWSVKSWQGIMKLK